jgi:hypothetical protein
MGIHPINILLTDIPTPAYHKVTTGEIEFLKEHDLVAHGKTVAISNAKLHRNLISSTFDTEIKDWDQKLKVYFLGNAIFEGNTTHKGFSNIMSMDELKEWAERFVRKYENKERLTKFIDIPRGFSKSDAKKLYEMAKILNRVFAETPL